MPSLHDEALIEQTARSECMYRGGFLEVRRDEARLADGSVHPREWVVHPGAAGILALGDDGRVLLVRQYRYAMHQVYTELPAGKIDAGESSLQTAQRELWEETGHLARDWAFLTQIHPAIGFCNERLDLYVARGLYERAGARPDAGEVLHLEWQSLEALIAAALSGTLPDVKTQIAVLRWHLITQGDWPEPEWTSVASPVGLDDSTVR